MAEDFKNQGNDYFKKQNFKKAIECYTKAIHLNRSEPTFYTNRASAYMAINNYDSALSDCRLALSINPDHPRALTRGARCLILLGKLAEAKEMMSHADRVQPNDPQVKEEYKDLSEAIQDLNDYKLFVGQKNYSQALHYVEKLCEISSFSWEFKTFKIETLIMQGDLNKCEEVIRETIKSYSNKPELYLYLGKVTYYKGNTNEAERILAQCRSIDSGFKEGNQMIKDIKRFEQAKDEANKLFSAKKTNEAIAAYTECLKFDEFNKSYNSIILSNRSACYITNKEYIKALTDINKAIELNPDFAKAFARRGNIRYHLEEFSEAMKDYNRAKELNPNYPDIDNLITSAQSGASNRKRKDYYSILGLEKGASDDQIKKAYRKAALKWHPDKNSETPEQKMEAEKKFKDINEAYAVLSDKNKKAIFDNGGDPEGGPGMGGFSGGGIDPSGIFQMFFGGEGGPGGAGGFSNIFSQMGPGASMFSNMGGGGNSRVFTSFGGGMPSFMRGGNFDSDFGGNEGFPGFSFNMGGKKSKRN